MLAADSKHHSGWKTNAVLSLHIRVFELSLVGEPDRIISQQSVDQFKDLAWKENRSRSPLTRMTSTLLSVTTALFGDSPSTPMVHLGNSCRASRNHPANLSVQDSDDILLQNSF